MTNVLLIGKNSYIGKNFINDYSNVLNISEYDSHLPLSVETFKNFDVVIHLAGIAHVSAKKKMDSLYFSVNRDLAIQSCDLAKKAGVKQFIFMSSMIIYGKDNKIGEPFIITEETKPNPCNAYGQSKLDADLYIQKQCDDNFKTLVIRTPMVYGDNCKGNVPKLKKLALKLPVLPSIHNERSVIEIHNLTRFFNDSIKEKLYGVYYPQDPQYFDTTNFMINYRKVNNKKSKESKFMSFCVKFASIFIGSFKKMYSSKIYEIGKVHDNGVRF